MNYLETIPIEVKHEVIQTEFVEKKSCSNEIVDDACDIIVVAHNALTYVQRCVESIFKYSDYKFNLIIVDNKSNYETKCFLKTLQNIKLITNEKNYGFGYANNKALRQSKSKYICFLNSDTIVKKGWLEELYKTLDSHNNCGAVGPLGNPKSSIINGNEIFFNQYRGQYRKDRKVDMLIGFCILISKKLFNDIGCWDEDFKIGNFEDNYLSYKIFSKGYELWISSKSKVLHRKPGRTFYANNINWAESMEYNQEIIKNKIKLLKT